MLVTATLTSIVVAIVCFAAGVRKVSCLFPIQVLISFVVTYSISSDVSDADQTALLTNTAIAALSFPLVWLMLRLILGPLQRGKQRKLQSHRVQANTMESLARRDDDSSGH